MWGLPAIVQINQLAARREPGDPDAITLFTKAEYSQRANELLGNKPEPADEPVEVEG